MSVPLFAIRTGSIRRWSSLNSMLEIHSVELTKYDLDERSIAGAGKLQQWTFLLLYAQNDDTKTRRRLLPGIEFETAITTIEPP